MPLVLDHLWCKILWRTAERVCLAGPVSFTAEAFREAKVYQLNMAILIEQEVFGLQISVGDPALRFVEVLQNEDKLGYIKSGSRFIETPHPPQVCENLSTRNIVEQHVDAVAVGKRGYKSRNERVSAHVAQDSTFVADMVQLFQPDNCAERG